MQGRILDFTRGEGEELGQWRFDEVTHVTVRDRILTTPTARQVMVIFAANSRSPIVTHAGKAIAMGKPPVFF